MSRAEKFILESTNYGSSDIIGWDNNGLPIYNPWLTPDQARKAVEIAMEEIIEKAQDWIADTFKYDGSEDFNGGANDAMSMLLDDFTNYIKGE